MCYGKHARSQQLILSVLIATMGLFGCGPQEEEEVAQTEEGSFVLGQAEVVERVSRGVSLGDRLLVLDGFRGTVRLDGAEADGAQLVFVKRARGQDDAAAREVLGGIGLEEQGDADRYTFVMRADQPVRSRVDVHGTVPPRTRLRLDFENGAVALAGVEGPVDVAHQSGGVQITDAAASVRVGIRNGDITVGMQHVPQGAEVALTTSNGDLTLALPEEASTQIAARTQAGEIRAQDLRFASRQLEPRGAGARFEAQLGDGNASVDLRTENGSIALRGTMLALPSDSLYPTPADTITDTTAVPPDTLPPDTTDTTVQDDTTAPPPDTIGL